MKGYDHGDKTYRAPQKGDGETIPKKAKGYHIYEKNESVVEDNVMKPGPVLSRATQGDYRKGKRPKGITSATDVANALAKHWGRRGKKAAGEESGERSEGGSEEFDEIYGF